jgi:hypothetical protein
MTLHHNIYDVPFDANKIKIKLQVTRLNFTCNIRHHCSFGERDILAAQLLYNNCTTILMCK